MTNAAVARSSSNVYGWPPSSEIHDTLAEWILTISDCYWFVKSSSLPTAASGNVHQRPQRNRTLLFYVRNDGSTILAEIMNYGLDEVIAE